MALLESQMLPTKSVPFGPATGKAGWRHMHTAMGFREGVLDATHMKASQRAAGGPGKFVDIAAGDGWVQGDDTARQGLYHEHNDAVLTLPTPDNTSGNPRFDQLILRVPDSSIAGASDIPVYEILQGTPNGSTTPDNRVGAAALPNGCFRIAEWVAGNGYTQVTDAMIRDRRTYALGAGFLASGSASGVAYSTGSASLVDLDTANFQRRLESNGVGPIDFELYGDFGHSGAAQFIVLELLQDGVVLPSLEAVLRRGPNDESHLWKASFTPSAGTHLYKIQWRTQSATASLQNQAAAAQSTRPTWRAVERTASAARHNGAT